MTWQSKYGIDWNKTKTGERLEAMADEARENGQVIVINEGFGSISYKTPNELITNWKQGCFRWGVMNFETISPTDLIKIKQDELNEALRQFDEAFMQCLTAGDPWPLPDPISQETK